MAITHIAISSQVLSTTSASVVFSSIPNTYTDLVVKINARGDAATAANVFYVNINGGSVQTDTRLAVIGSGGLNAASTTAGSLSSLFAMDYASATTNAFAAVELYIPNYTLAANKPYLSVGGAENNTNPVNTGSTFPQGFDAGLYGATTAVSSLTFTAIATSNFIAGSRFDLYGITHF
jgi:hypothetical protein